MEHQNELSQKEREELAETEKGHTIKEAEMLRAGGNYMVNEQGEVVAFKFSEAQVNEIKKLAETKRWESLPITELIAQFPELAERLEAIEVGAPYLEGNEQLVLLREKQTPEVATLVYSNGRPNHDDRRIDFWPSGLKEYGLNQISPTSIPCIDCLPKNLPSYHNENHSGPVEDEFNSVKNAIIAKCVEKGIRVVSLDATSNPFPDSTQGIGWVHFRGAGEIKKAFAITKGIDSKTIEAERHNRKYDLGER